jgi:methionyl-tRNA synthetase
MVAGGVQQPVEPGSLVLLDAFRDHELRNSSAQRTLLYMGLVWEQAARVQAAHAALSPAFPATPNVYLTATPPTPNADLHVGHLSGPYLRADVLRRWLEGRGFSTGYVSGVDNHQSYTVRKAERDATTPLRTAQLLGDRMRDTLQRAGMRPDHFARPERSPYHRALVLDVFSRLHAAGQIVRREQPALYCDACERWLFEAYVSGICPHCGRPSDGNACEACGRPNDCVNLGAPRCNGCGGTPRERLLERFYFPLAPFAERLRAYHRTLHMNDHMRALCENMLADGLPDIAVSQAADWGIPVPVAGFEDQVINAWFEMGPGYLAATQEWLAARGEPADWRSVWTSPEHTVLQLFGFDNGYFHALLFPAMFMAYDPAIVLPAAFVTNEFFLYEGEKFSSSRGHALWGDELLARVAVDHARFYLAYCGPEQQQTNFRLSELEHTVRRELSERWAPWLRGVCSHVAEEYGGCAPATGAWTDAQRRFHRSLERVVADLSEAYDPRSLSLQRVVRVLMELVRSAQEFGQTALHWRNVRACSEERRTAVALELMALNVLAIGVGPIMPDFGTSLDRALGRPQSCQRLEFVAPGTRIVGLERAAKLLQLASSSVHAQGETL